MALRKLPRIPGFDYTGNAAYNLTFVTRSRAPHFQNEQAVTLCLRALAEACHKYGYSALAYCFMPDHCHLLAISETGKSLHDFAHHFKQISGYEFKRRTGTHLWQISYYDHVLRNEEAIHSIARYIWNNPVRAGLVQEGHEYPYSGPPGWQA